MWCVGWHLHVAPARLIVVLPPQRGAMEGETLQKFYTQLVLLPKVMHYAQYVLLALGCALLLVSVVCLVRSQVGGTCSAAPAAWPSRVCWSRGDLAVRPFCCGRGHP